MDTKLFHVSLSLGRTDTQTYEADSKSKLLAFFNTVSEAVVRNIKQIVMSKEYKINYIKKDFVATATYHRVIVHAMSKNYSESYTLFHIKKTVTEDDIKKQFKKILIKNEPIVDFISIQFFNEGVSPTNTDNLYQVQYRRNSRTYTVDYHGLSWQHIRDLAESLIDGEITEIRKYVHHDPTVKKDTQNNYYNSVSCYMSSEDRYRSVKIPKIKHTIKHSELLDQVKNTFKVHGDTVDINNISTKYN
jgi:hypothetical protein